MSEPALAALHHSAEPTPGKACLFVNFDDVSSNETITNPVNAAFANPVATDFDLSLHV